VDLKDKLFRKLAFFLTNYLISPGLGVLICLLEAIGRIRFVHFGRFPIWEEKLIIVSNHPSLLEPFIIPLAWFPWMNFPWLFSPLWSRMKFSLSWFRELQRELSQSPKFIPANVPDNRNFYEAPYWVLFRGINVPIDRNGSEHGRIRTVMALKNILDKGGRVLIFPEGTRTYKAMQKSGIKSVKGKQLGGLKSGAAWLATKTDARILPIWVEGTDKVLPNGKFPLPRLWHKVIIKIGTPFSVMGNTRKEVNMEISQALLELADDAD